MCEKEGFIPRFYIDGPNDKVDKVIMDMQIYTRDLVTEELGLGNLIENAIQQLQKEKEAEDELKEENITLEEELFNYDKTEEVTDSDYTEFNEFTKELSEEDYEALYEQLKEDER